ncbi:MAG: hypothetical protein ABIJ23_04190 [Candidatus Magasanikbacteria bacterium]
MFDDQMPKTSGQVPSNLPIGEPEDMFSGVEPVEEPIEPATPLEQAVEPASASALDAGILRPIAEREPTQQRPEFSTMPDVAGVEQSSEIQQPTPPGTISAGNTADIYAIKEPALTRGLVGIIIVIVAVVILGSGGWWIYNSFIKTTSQQDAFVIAPPVDLDTMEEETVLVEESIITEDQDVANITEETEETTSLEQDIIDDQILFGEPIDTDGDGLDDERELGIGTDPNNWDTDGDELSDGDEVTIWKTQPLNPDTDGDTFLDGAEIKNGYNPDGPGKLFEPPAEEVEGGEGV